MEPGPREPKEKKPTQDAAKDAPSRDQEKPAQRIHVDEEGRGIAGDLNDINPNHEPRERAA